MSQIEVDRAINIVRSALSASWYPVVREAWLLLTRDVERLRAIEARVRAMCTADRRIQWEDGSYSVSVLDPDDILRALNGED